MLTGLLPGLRQTRTPLIVGSICLVVAWIAFGGERLTPTVDSPLLGLRRLAELGQLLGRGPVLAALALAAFLIGSLLTRRPTIWFGRLREQDTWGAFEQWREDLREGSGRVDELLHAQSRTLGDPRPAGLPGILQTYDSVEQVIRAALDDFRGIVSSLRTHQSALYSEFDRLESEAELRYSLILPLYALSLVVAATISWWWLVALALPIAANRDGDRLARSAAQFVFEAMANGFCDSPYAAALRQARAAIPESVQPETDRSTVLDTDNDFDELDDEFQFDEEPKWWSQTRLWIGRAVWPGGAFSWSLTPWDQEGRDRQIRNWPRFIPRHLLGGKKWEYDKDTEAELDELETEEELTETLEDDSLDGEPAPVRSDWLAVTSGSTQDAQITGTFELYQDEKDTYHFRLKVDYGQVLTSSEGYLTKADATAGIRAVQGAAAGALIDDLTEGP